MRYRATNLTPEVQFVFVSVLAELLHGTQASWIENIDTEPDGERLWTSTLTEKHFRLEATMIKRSICSFYAPQGLSSTSVNSFSSFFIATTKKNSFLSESASQAAFFLSRLCKDEKRLPLARCRMSCPRWKLSEKLQRQIISL